MQRRTRGTASCGSRPGGRPARRGGDAARHPAHRHATSTEHRQRPERPAHRGGPRRRRRPARPPAPRGARDRAPLPVRPARRGRDRAAAARRHAVPDDVLPDLPPARPARSARWRPRGDEGDDRAARPTTPSSPPRYRRAHEDYLRRRRRARQVQEIEGFPAGGMPTGSSACTCWSATRWPPAPGVNPLGDEALALLPRLVGSRVLRARAGRRTTARPERGAAA